MFGFEPEWITCSETRVEHKCGGYVFCGDGIGLYKVHYDTNTGGVCSQELVGCATWIDCQSYGWLQ